MENKEKEYLEIIDSFAEGAYIKDLEKGEICFSNEWKKRLGMEHLSPKLFAGDRGANLGCGRAGESRRKAQKSPEKPVSFWRFGFGNELMNSLRKGKDC
ncbi:hypothetical protein [Dehalobacterium formicoaceticum]|uniref:hypothetical protein n=1 Tax=Dehalobacterium formicoaceticum TaxID=51515 RepID=UPI000B7E8674|nr:hypothetical protein [Dehalobacterium formicoaceticum]